ncbi:MAG: hypothetical protein OJJ54_22695 [Pseudonocardia sp.]|nr:hypothetical protein [Pseudonocardia sp.]
MYCASCSRPTDEARTLSTHHTSDGWVRYRLCGCGTLSIQLLELAASGLSEQGIHAATGART